MEVPEAEEVEQEIENLFEKIMTANFPNLMKEIDIQVQEAQRIQNNMNPKRPTPRHIVIKLPKFKDKERILKAAREKQLVTYKGPPKRLSADLSTIFADCKGLARNIHNYEKQGPTTKIALPREAII